MTKKIETNFKLKNSKFWESPVRVFSTQKCYLVFFAKHNNRHRKFGFHRAF